MITDVALLAFRLPIANSGKIESSNGFGSILRVNGFCKISVGLVDGK